MKYYTYCDKCWDKFFSTNENEENECQEQFLTDTVATTPKNKRKKADPLEDATLQYIKRSNEVDEEHQFGQAIAASLRKLNGIHKSGAKLRIQQVIYECECAQYNEEKQNYKYVHIL